MEWLVPICLFWTLTALYLGGFPVDVVGGNGFRQVMGLIDSYVLFILVWALLRALLGGLGGLLWSAVLPAILVTLALPLIIWAGYIVMGVRVQKGERPH
jgi:F0F1-type ATP synthase membrane subunit a